MTTSSIIFLQRAYTPFAFRPQTERRVVAVLTALAAVVWLLVIPLELALG
jgi:hypothetical protein